MRHIEAVRVVVALVLLGALASPVAPASSGGPATVLQFVHGIGTTPGDNPVDVYVAEGAATTWDLVPGGPVAYTEVLEVRLFAGDHSFLLCDAVTDPASTVDSCPEGEVNPGGTAVVVPEATDAVLVAGYGPPEGEPAITFDVFEVDTSCLFADQARFQVAHASAMEEVTLFIDGERDERGPFSHGESETVGLPRGEYDLLLVTTGDEFFVLDEPDVAAEAVETTFLALIGPGDPTPLDPATTDLRLVSIAFGVEPCPEPTVPPTTSTSTLPDPGPPADPQPEPPDFTG